MQTVPRTTKIVHYASFVLNGQDVEGTAERTSGGYVFRPSTGTKAILVDYRNVDLYLFGVVSIADAQHTDDMAHGGYAHIACSRRNEPITTGVERPPRRNNAMLILETLILLGACGLISGLLLSGIARWLHHL